MIDIFLDTLIDSVKLLPFLFITFLLMEYIEHRFSNKSKQIITSSKKIGPLIGSILGTFPQCGFSAAATSFYATRVISLGTLISIYLSTSDEMLPILISSKAKISLIFLIIGIKVVIGMTLGFIIDLIFRKKEEESIKDFCEESHCHCKNNIFISAIKHTLSTLLFIFIITLIFNLLIENFDKKIISKIFMKNSLFAPFLSSFIALLPSCASSILIVELYLKNIMTFGSMIGGLLTGCGVGILVLFKENKNLKENIKILIMIYLIGSIFGILINFLGVFK